MTVAFTVFGIAQPAGSKKGFYNQKTQRVIITDDAKKSRPWKTDVSQQAGVAMVGRQLLHGPLVLTVIFHVPRPKGHYGTGRNADAVRSSAPQHPTVKPDVTKLLRAVEDALTGVVWRDDAQVVSQHVVKRYGAPARVEVHITQLEDQQTLQERTAA